MARRTQTLDLKPGAEIVLETPEGLVIIRQNPAHKRKLDIELPENMAAHKGVDRAMSRPRFLNLDANGRFTPTFQVLVPVMAEDGSLSGVRLATLVRAKQGD